VAARSKPEIAKLPSTMTVPKQLQTTFWSFTMTARTTISAITMAAVMTLASGAPSPIGSGLVGPSPAAAQRAPVQAQWELLGEARVALRGDSDVIEVARDEDYYRNKSYRRLRLVIDGGDVRLRAVKLVYLNGHIENLTVARTLSAGEEIVVDLKGERSYLKTVVLEHKGRLSFSFGRGGLRIGTPTVRVFGENVRFFVPPPPPPPVVADVRRPRDWEPLGTERFDRRADKVVIPVGRREGRLGQIALRIVGEPVVVRELRIRFGNGDVQEVSLDKRLREGDRLAPIDLEGDRRFIEQVTALLDPRPRGGQVGITVLGLDRPGDQGPRAAPVGELRDTWVPLGRKTLSPGLDRDMIEVSTPADGPRAKSFDRLHFVADTNDVLIRAITVTYLNGHVEDLAADKRIPAGGELTVDLPGRRSYLRRIEMVYASRPGSGRPTIVSVFGERIGRDVDR